jgi:uncharacterized membrane protein
MGGMMMCSHCHGIYKITFGVLLLLNAYVWPKWLGFDGWVAWIALLMILGGVLALTMGGKCPRCAALQGSMAEKGKRK